MRKLCEVYAHLNDELVPIPIRNNATWRPGRLPIKAYIVNLRHGAVVERIS
jgi:hypothetical protein